MSIKNEAINTDILGIFTRFLDYLAIFILAAWTPLHGRLVAYIYIYMKWNELLLKLATASSEDGKELVLMNTFLYRGFNVSAPGQLQTE